MNKFSNCIPLDSEDVRRITWLYRLCKRIRDKGYTTSQIEHDVQYINSQIKLAVQEDMLYSLAIPEEFCYCEQEDLCAIFSLYGFKCEFDSVKDLLRIEW